MKAAKTKILSWRKKDKNNFKKDLFLQIFFVYYLKSNYFYFSGIVIGFFFP